MTFESPDENLEALLGKVGSGKLQLPDFQREWKWDDDHIVSLLASISLGYPVGVVMTLEISEDGVQFAPKPIAGVELGSHSDPDELLLDGQQRLTSLFQALASDKPVDTTDSRGKRLKRWYYVDMARALGADSDREEAILSVPEDRKLRDNFGRDVVADYSTLENECKAEMFPLGKIFDAGSFFSWNNAYLKSGADDPGNRSARWLNFYESVLKHFVYYKVPVIRLNAGTPKEAVCTVFEKVNTGGVPLNVFELLTAIFAADEFRLKDDWAARKARFDKRPVLQSLESADFLQAVSLLTTYGRRQAYLTGGGDPNQAPGVSAKRKEILRLALADYKAWADKVTDAFEWAGKFLAQERVFRAADLPYRSQLVPLAAIRASVGADTDTHGNAQRLREWYWCGVLGELYGGATETRFARDLEQVVDWLKGGQAPGTVVEASFRAQRLLTLRTRNSAAYKGIYALLMRRDCLDWVRRESMTLATFFDYQVDIHHIFPKDWCDKNDITPERRESVVNKTAISATTNRSIGGRSPKDYMPSLATRAGVSDKEIDDIVATHLIEATDLRVADFDSFFDRRAEALLGLISEAMGKEAIRDVDPSEGDPAAFVEEPDDPEDLIAVG
jgi:hypothetical protein